MVAPPSAEPSAEIVAVVRRIFGGLLRQGSVGPDDDFFRLGGHSLLAARLIHQIQAETGVRIPVRLLFDHSTPRTLAQAIADAGTSVRGPGDGGPSAPVGLVSVPRPPEAGAEPPGGAAGTAREPAPPAVVPVRPEGTRTPLFVVPGVGSRILYLRHLANRLGSDQPIYGLHSRFLEDGSLYGRVEDLAERYVRDLTAIQARGPYRVLGFSYGGLVALEVARQLVAAGHHVEFLGVVDTRLPDLRQHGPWSIPRSIPRRLLNLAAILQPLSAAGRRTYLRTRLRIARESVRAHLIEALAAVIRPALLDRLMPHPYGPEEMDWLAVDRAASRRYEPGPFPGRIVYFWAAHSQRPPHVYDHREGWAELALGGLDVRPIPGSHLTVMLEPLIRSTAGAIRDALDDAERAPTSRVGVAETQEGQRRAG